MVVPPARVPILMLVQIVLLPLGTPYELLLSSSTVRASVTASQETGYGRCGIRTSWKATKRNHVGKGASCAISGAKLQGDKDGCCWERRLSRRGLFDAGAMGAGVTWFAMPSQVQAGLPESMKYSREIPCILADSRVFLRAGRQFEVQQEMADSTSSGGSTGTSVWEASVVLSEFMQSGLPEGFWHGKRVLELGAGAGFTSILAASLGAKQVVASDGNSYERAAIQDVLTRGNGRSPLTRETLNADVLIPNNNLRKRIREITESSTSTSTSATPSRAVLPPL